MIGPEVARAGLRWATFLVVASAILLLLLEPGTASFVVTVFTLGLGFVFGAVLVLLLHLSRRKP